MRGLSKSLVAALLIGAVAPAVAAAQPAAVAGDVRCLLTMARLATVPQRRAAAQVGIYFFAGRISAQDPGFDLPAGLKAAAAQMTARDFEAESKRCGPMVVSTLQSLEAAQTTFSASAARR